MAHSIQISGIQNPVSFWSSGQKSILLGAFLFTEVSFMVWILIGVLGVHIARDLGLSPSKMGLLAALPILTGTLGRLPVGIMVDRVGPKRVGMGILTLIAVTLLALWKQPFSGNSMIFIYAIGLGLAGVSFSIAMPLVSSHYPPEHQGMALGLTAVGGVGTVTTALVAPRLAENLGWQTVFGLTIPLVLLTMGLFWILNKKERTERPTLRPWSHYLQAIRYSDSVWFSFFYAVTFGGFISLTASLVLFFHTQLQMTPSQAGELTALSIVGGALFRPIGGWMADRFGGIRTLQISFSLVAVSMILLAMSETILFLIVIALFTAMSGLGAGNGAIFQLIPLRFPRRMGIVTGLVGSVGGVGGFLLVWGFGLFQETTGNYKSGFVLLAGLCVLALFGLWSVKKQWRTTWGSPSRTRGRV